jgi:NAD(P)H dehydrogenase (quinone)
MFAVTGITGNVGGEVARGLLSARKPVRAIVRDIRKAAAWAERGCEVAVADIGDTAALVDAFTGVEGVFVLVPPNFDPAPGFPEAQATAARLRAALERARPERVVYLSTIGAQAAQSNLLSQHTIIEKALLDLPTPITFLRPAWFMENCSWDVAPARAQGVIPSFLQPLDKPVPMVATKDIGRVAAEQLQTPVTGHTILELEGPRRVTPSEIAVSFARLLGHPVRMETVPRDTWDALFLSQGMKNPEPRIRMLDGFNEGWIEFERGEAGSRKGSAALEAVLKSLITPDRTSSGAAADRS